MTGPSARAVPKARRQAAPQTFSVKDALLRASCQLAQDPPPWITRPAKRGYMVARFALPLTCCPTGHMMRHAPGWKLGKLKGQCMALMSSQLESRPSCPLEGRPQVLVMRFSSVEPDGYADFGKIPVDCLKKLGFIVDDSPRRIELHQWTEKSAPRAGCVVVEVWSGR